jgi:ABC-type glycerol-3-phosphate transport system substrate-binding protein
MCYRGRPYAVPSAAGTAGLFWNKHLYKEAGLDPETPPVTIAGLDSVADRLTFFRDPETDSVHAYPALLERLGDPEKTRRFIVEQELELVQAGYLPCEPGWWNWAWGYFFGGSLLAGSDSLTVCSAENVRAFRWVQSFMKKYGGYTVKKFVSGFGQYSSPQNAFLAGKVAMVMQGVWMGLNIRRFAPELEWGAAPFPTVTRDLYGTTPYQTDVFVIPKGALDPEGAFAFLSFMARPENADQLTLHLWISGLSENTPDYLEKHANPFFRVFWEMARSKHIFIMPRIAMVEELTEDLIQDFSRIWLELEDPEKVLAEIQARKEPLFRLEIASIRERERRP